MRYFYYEFQVYTYYIPTSTSTWSFICFMFLTLFQNCTVKEGVFLFLIPHVLHILRILSKWCSGLLYAVVGFGKKRGPNSSEKWGYTVLVWLLHFRMFESLMGTLYWKFYSFFSIVVLTHFGAFFIFGLRKLNISMCWFLKSCRMCYFIKLLASDKLVRAAGVFDSHCKFNLLPVSLIPVWFTLEETSDYLYCKRVQI